jgi:signal transduction histidine kinase
MGETRDKIVSSFHQHAGRPGTGLDLSLSYDIVKAHGGEIKVETNAGEGSKFIIQLPIR